MDLNNVPEKTAMLNTPLTDDQQDKEQLSEESGTDVEKSRVHSTEELVADIEKGKEQLSEESDNKAALNPDPVPATVTINEDQYLRVFKNDPPMSFEEFTASAKNYGALIDNVDKDKVGFFANSISILGYIVGVFGAIVTIGLSYSLGGMMLSIFIAWSYSAIALKLAVNEQDKDDVVVWKWGILQSLSCLFFFSGCMSILGVVNDSIDWQTGFTFIVILPSIAFAIFVYLNFGCSHYVMVFNIYFMHFFFVCSLISMIIGEDYYGDKPIGAVTKWYTFTVGLLTQIITTYFLEFTPPVQISDKKDALRLMQYICDKKDALRLTLQIASLIVVIPLHIILRIPSTNNFGLWIIYIFFTAYFFLLAGLNMRTYVPMLLGLLGVFMAILKSYMELSDLLPDNAVPQFILATVFLGGSAVLLVTVAPGLQKYLNEIVKELFTIWRKGKKDAVISPLDKPTPK